ncbi:hypothetical protein D1AOALGA4SA_12294 [Olavius algarvensis Delta 1 endosymbiont]|nr:hypothetical protein D1AOALGA4SA_12294 [Olavius algarvensis Delta 1 endosymbiont]
MKNESGLDSGMVFDRPPKWSPDMSILKKLTSVTGKLLIGD